VLVAKSSFGLVLPSSKLVNHIFDFLLYNYYNTPMSKWVKPGEWVRPQETTANLNGRPSGRLVHEPSLINNGPQAEAITDRIRGINGDCRLSEAGRRNMVPGLDWAAVRLGVQAVTLFQAGEGEEPEPRDMVIAQDPSGVIVASFNLTRQPQGIYLADTVYGQTPELQATLSRSQSTIIDNCVTLSMQQPYTIE
jgi:hypothetical protein